MKYLALSARTICVSAIALLFMTCKRQNTRLTDTRIEKDNTFIEWHIERTPASLATRLQKAASARTPMSANSCFYSDAYVSAYGVSRTGSCSGGYTYTLRLDDIVVIAGGISGRPTSPQVMINGYIFALHYAWSSGSSYHYWLNVPYTSIGLTDADYCSTASLTLGFIECSSGSPFISETIQLTPSEACGSTNPDATTTTAHYSYPPTTMSAPRTGGADLGLLINLCSTCTVRYPDYYVFQYRPTGTTTWTSVTVPYPQYQLYSLPLSSGTYDLQGYNECAPGSPVPNNGPVVSGSPTTFTVL